MRINKFIALATGMSRRKVDDLIASGKVKVNNSPATLGQDVTGKETVTVNGKPLNSAVIAKPKLTIIINKPVGYVVSRKGQGSKTIYDLLPVKYHQLKPIGRLDKDSSGLLLLTNDGQLSYELTHPRNRKEKIYKIGLDKPLTTQHMRLVSGKGVKLDDGLSRLKLNSLHDNDRSWLVTMHEGRNRQIRRTFASLGYKVTSLHRISFGKYRVDHLKLGNYQET